MWDSQNEELTGGYFNPEFASELKRFFSYGNRRTGRTDLLARIIVDTCIETGKEITLFDHHSIFDYKHSMSISTHLFDACIRVIREYNSKGCEIGFRDNNRRTISVSIHPNSYELYKKLRIPDSPHYPRNQNPFPVGDLQKRLQELKKQEVSKLLLII